MYCNNFTTLVVFIMTMHHDMKEPGEVIKKETVGHL